MSGQAVPQWEARICDISLNQQICWEPSTAFLPGSPSCHMNLLKVKCGFLPGPSWRKLYPARDAQELPLWSQCGEDLCVHCSRLRMQEGQHIQYPNVNHLDELTQSLFSKYQCSTAPLFLSPFPFLSFPTGSVRSGIGYHLGPGVGWGVQQYSNLSPILIMIKQYFCLEICLLRSYLIISSPFQGTK